MVEKWYSCECCGEEFGSGRTRSGERLCKECIGLRRCLRPHVERIGMGQVLGRAGKLLLGDAQKASRK